MLASIGDRIFTTPGTAGGPMRSGVIVELHHPGGTPPYVVEWSDTGERTLVFPGTNSSVQHSPGSDPLCDEAVTRVWRIQVSLVEHGDRTTADAVLVGEGLDHLRASGRARRDPRDEPVALIGDEIAVGRALRRLADRILDDAEVDIERSTGDSVHIHP